MNEATTTQTTRAEPAPREGLRNGPSRLASVSLDAAGTSHVGLERSRNEDQFLIATLHRQMVVRASSEELEPSQWMLGSPEGVLLAVADGIGGHGDGDVAASVAVRAVAEYACNVMPWVDRYTLRAAVGDHERPHAEVREGLQGAVAQGQARLDRLASQHGVSPRMGTSLTVAYVAWPQLYLAHLGDSRCYLHRGDQLYRVTTDHTVANRVADMGVDLDADSPFGGMLWKALGGGDETTHEPDVMRVALQHEDVLLLCTDGLTKHLSNEQISAALTQQLPAQTVCQQLVEQANAEQSTDNVTVVVARAPSSTPSP